MSLDEQQKAQVAEWFAAGESLDSIQKRIKTEFGIHLTYLDVRLLVAELPQPEEKAPEQGQEPAPAQPAAEHDEADRQTTPDAMDAGAPVPDGGEPGQNGEVPPTGGVQVTMDTICPPGVIACGGVVFGDGTSGKWYLDQMGRMGLSDVPPGYRPSPEDAAGFQQELVSLLRSKGMM